MRVNVVNYRKKGSKDIFFRKHAFGTLLICTICLWPKKTSQTEFASDHSHPGLGVGKNCLTCLILSFYICEIGTVSQDGSGI